MVEYVPAIMPTSVAAAKSKSWPTLKMSRPISDSTVISESRMVRERHSLIASAAQVAGCSELFTEELQDNLVLGAARVVNPFRVTPELLKGR